VIGQGVHPAKQGLEAEKSHVFVIPDLVKNRLDRFFVLLLRKNRVPQETQGVDDPDEKPLVKNQKTHHENDADKKSRIIRLPLHPLDIFMQDGDDEHDREKHESDPCRGLIIRSEKTRDLKRVRGDSASAKHALPFFARVPTPFWIYELMLAK